MINRASKVIPIWFFLFYSASVLAEGIVDIKPYLSTSLDYDDNVFRFSSPNQAKAQFGSSTTSDVIKRVDLGVTVNLRLSRQLVTVSSSVNESRYNRFDILNNTGRSNSLGWSWKLGNDLYGELSTSESAAIAGFTEIKKPVKNLRTSTHQVANIYWNFQPDWTLSADREIVKSENELNIFNALNRYDDVYEGGIHYQNQRATQLGLAYRVVDSRFPNRTGFTQFFFGDESAQKEIVVTASWLPTSKTKISTRLAEVTLNHRNLPQRDFVGFSQRWNLDHSLTDKENVNLTAYQEVSPVDDVLSTYVKTKGISVNPVWTLTSKVSLHAGLGYEERIYLGSAGLLLSNTDRYDESKLGNLSLIYTPTNKSMLQVQYQGEKRTSNLGDFGYQFNNIDFSFRYDF